MSFLQDLIDILVDGRRKPELSQKASFVAVMLIFMTVSFAFAVLEPRAAALMIALGVIFAAIIVGYILYCVFSDRW